MAGPERIAIAGVGNTEVGRFPQVSCLELQAKAARLALEDAGLTQREVDAVICQSPFIRPHFFNAESLAEYLGIRPQVTVTLCGGAVALTMLDLAVGLLTSRRAGVVLCVYGENASSATRGITGLPLGFEMGGEEFEHPFGGTAPPVQFALLAQRYLYEYKAPVEALGAVAISTRKHALLNPRAFRREPLGLEDYKKAKVVAWPLRVPDCAVITDGGAAFVVTSLERAADSPKKPVHVLGLGSKTTHRQLSQAPPLRELGIRESGHTALGMAGVSIGDVDVALLYDCFTIAVLLQLEGLGFCGDGEAAAYVMAGGMELGRSRCPINTDGGLLAYAHLAGMLRVNEAVHQLRGEAGERQVPDARLALVTCIAGWLSTHRTAVLGRD